MDDFVFLGFINAQITACGFLGGMVRAFRDEDATPWQIVKLIITGGVAANFIAPQVLGVLVFLHVSLVYFVAFGIGLSGKLLCYVMELAFNGLFGKTENE